MKETHLSRYFEMTNPGENYAICTCDTWTIPAEGAEIWCSGWQKRKIIKPYGDGCHVDVGGSCYHCDELMDILCKNEKEGFKWGIEGVNQTRRQHFGGKWQPVEINTRPEAEPELER